MTDDIVKKKTYVTAGRPAGGGSGAAALTLEEVTPGAAAPSAAGAPS